MLITFFSINTLTTGIYNAWISFDDLNLANRLSFYLLIFILGLFLLENLSRKKAQYHLPSKGGFKSKLPTVAASVESILSGFHSSVNLLFLNKKLFKE